MKQDYIKQEISTEICEAGGATVRLTGKTTTGLETTMSESKDALCVIGDEGLVYGQFVGLLKSMADGVQRDGHSRQLAEYLTFYPQPTGAFDLDKGWDPAVNSMKLGVRVLNKLKIDTSNWQWNDVTPGRIPFTIDSVSTGAEKGLVKVGEQVHVNGRNLPATDKIRVDWAVEGTAKKGTVPAAKVTSDATRANIAADALDELKDVQYIGKTIVFTIRGNFCKQTAKATLLYVPVAPTVTVTGVKSNGATLPDRLIAGATTVASGANLAVIAGDTLKASWMHEGELFEHTIDHTKLTPNAAGTEITFSMTDACPEITSQCAGDIVMFTFTLHGGVAGSPAQTVSHTAEVVASAL